MNKQELIEYCESLKGDLNKFINGVDVDKIIAKIEQLDEPQKVVVPLFVADWYEENKDCLNYSIWQYVYNWHDQEETEFKRWFACSKNSFETLIGMSHYGYEVEREKRYLVKMKNVSPECECLYWGMLSKTWLFKVEDIYGEFRKHHTRKELEEAGFGWVFDCEGIEVEEV